MFHMAGRYTPKTQLTNLEYNPKENPLLSGFEVKTRTKKLVKTQIQSPDLGTGEVHSSNVFVTKELDEEQFVKVFSDGIRASYDLTKTAHRVFQAVLSEYENTPMSGGYVDTIHLQWFDGGLSGESIGMKEKTFRLGLRELLDKGFLSPKIPNVYWVNPSLFFKGDRVRFIREFTVKRTKKLNSNA